MSDNIFAPDQADGAVLEKENVVSAHGDMSMFQQMENSRLLSYL